MTMRLVIGFLLLVLAVQIVMALPEPDTFRVKKLDYGRVDDLAWSPDGHTLAVAVQKGVYLLNEHYEQIAFLPGDKVAWRGVEWNHDGTRLAVMNWVDYSSDKCYVSLWQGTEVEQRLLFCGAVVWGYHSDWFAIINRRAETLVVWNLDHGLSEPFLSQRAIDAAFSPDDRYLAYADAEEKFTVWDLSENAVEFDLEAGGESVSWSSDGQYLITTLSTGTKLKARDWEGPAYAEWRAFSAIYLWTIEGWYGRIVIEMPDDFDAKAADLIDGDTLFSACNVFAPGTRFEVTGDVCIYQPETPGKMSSFQMVTNNEEYGYELSPNHRYYIAWNCCGLKVYELDAYDESDRTFAYVYLEDEMLGKTSAYSMYTSIVWTPDSRYIIAVDAEGWLYQYDVAKLDFDQ